MHLLNFCKTLPKIELHAHLNGSVSMITLQKLAARSGMEFQLPEKQAATMEEVFKLFPLVQAVTSTPAAVRIATQDVINDFAQDNTIYLELRTTPKDKPGFPKKEYIDKVIEGIRATSHLPIVVRLLLSIDRRQTLEEAEDAVRLAAADDSGLIVGIDLSGDPSVDGRKFLPLLHKARDAGLKIGIHLAEVDSCLEEVDEFLEFRPDRIGHGTFLHTKQEWVESVVKKRIPFEICLTSNQITNTATIADSHLPFWKERGVPVAISTDDMGLMGTSLSREFHIAAKTFELSAEDLISIAKDSLNVSFLQKDSEEFNRVSKIIEEFASKQDL